MTGIGASTAEAGTCLVHAAVTLIHPLNPAEVKFIFQEVEMSSLIKASVDGRNNLLSFRHSYRTIMFRITSRTLTRGSRYSTSPLTARSFTAARQVLSSNESDLTHPALLKDPPSANPSSATDPWTLKPPPLPETPLPVNQDGQVVQTMDELLASPHPEGRDNEEAETLRKRLVYESRKRGILEMDLIFGTFAKTRLQSMSERELREYDRVSAS